MNIRRLLVSEQDASEEIVTRVLSGYVLLADDTRRVLFTGEGRQLSGRAKVLLLLAAQHAWRFVTPGEQQDTALTIAQIEEQTGLPGNTVRPILKSLKDEHIIESPRKGAYRLPPHFLPEVEGFVKDPAATSRRRRGRKTRRRPLGGAEGSHSEE